MLNIWKFSLIFLAILEIRYCIEERPIRRGQGRKQRRQRARDGIRSRVRRPRQDDARTNEVDSPRGMPPENAPDDVRPQRIQIERNVDTSANDVESPQRKPQEPDELHVEEKPRRRRREVISANGVELPPIPLLSVSLTIDPKGYVPRLLRSIDYPVEAVIIQVGNPNKERLQRLVSSLQHTIDTLPHLNASILNVVGYNPGSARGFNFGLHNCIKMDKPWVLVVNSDIAFFPGTLQNIAVATYQGPVKFDIGFMSLTGHWSGVIITRHCIDTIGYFDENIYPAFYEDDDYGIRIQHAKLKPFIIPNSSALHGEADGSKGYVSGTGTLINSKDKNADPDWKRLGAQIAKGMEFSRWYLSKKWGWHKNDFLFGGKHEICKYPEGMEGKCVTPFVTPFNDPQKPLTYWRIHAWAIRRIMELYS